MCDIFERDTVKPYKQITQLNKKHNCRITGNICSIKSLFFWFDKINNVVPSKLEFFNGKMTSDYSCVKIIKITDKENLHKKYDKDNTLLLYYKDSDTISKYKNLLQNSESFKTLVDSYILDWNFNKQLISDLNDAESQYIELNYYIFK